MIGYGTGKISKLFFRHRYTTIARWSCYQIGSGPRKEVLPEAKGRGRFLDALSPHLASCLTGIARFLSQFSTNTHPAPATRLSLHSPLGSRPSIFDICLGQPDRYFHLYLGTAAAVMLAAACDFSQYHRLQNAKTHAAMHEQGVGVRWPRIEPNHRGPPRQISRQPALASLKSHGAMC